MKSFSIKALICSILVMEFPYMANAENGTGASGWIIGSPAIQMLKRAGASDQLINAAFDHPNSYIISRPAFNNTPPNATSVQTYTSIAEIQRAIDSSSIPASTKAILYDVEKWAFTPQEEQMDPVGFAAKAAALAHKHHLLLIVTPATNLAAVLQPGAGNKYDIFLELKIIPRLAKIADILEVQAQGAQGTPRYAEFVRAASAQARAANPSIILYAGMSTNPMGRAITANQLLTDYEATRAFVSGYWLNIPGGSAYCPSCGAPRPEVALEFLNAIYSVN